MHATGISIKAVQQKAYTGHHTHLHARDCEVGDLKLDLDGGHLAMRLLLSFYRGQVKVAPADEGHRAHQSGKENDC
jgi:hypothetical protein